MKKYENKTSGMISLKAKIRGFELVSKAIRNEALKKSGSIRSDLKLKKRHLGSDCRHHLIAYALLRGIEFKRLERRCHDGNDVSHEKILKIIEEHSPFGRFDNKYRRWTAADVTAKLVREQS